MILIFKFSLTPLLLLVESLDDGVSIVESQLASLGKILDGGLLVARFRTGNASVVVSLGKVGVDTDGNGIVIDGLGQLVAPCMQVATVVIHIGVVAVLTDGVAEVGLGRMEIGNALVGSEKYQYVLPFEFISIFLLACIIGGLVVARKEEKE